MTDTPWPELIEEVQLELTLLRRLIDDTAGLRRTVGEGAGDEVAKLAAAAMLQSFYNGVENVLDAFARRVDDDRPTGQGRHQQLLRRMGEIFGDRPPVLSPELRDGLAEYLEFRNSFRYGHHFRLDWSLAAALVEQAPATLDRFEAELDRFVRDVAARRLIGRERQVEPPAYWFAPPPAETRGGRARKLLGPCLLACLLGAAVGVGGWWAWQRISASDARPVPEGIPSLPARLREPLGPGQDRPAVARALGVLDFLARDGWRFTRADAPPGGGAMVIGRNEDLEARAELLYDAGRIARIDLLTPFDHYTYLVTSGRLATILRHAAPSQKLLERIDLRGGEGPAVPEAQPR